MRDKEFDDVRLSGLTFSQSMDRALRCFDIGKSIVFQPDAVVGMGLAVTSVVGLGIAEGFMLSRPGAARRISFAVRYGFSQFLPSVIWFTRPPALVANKMRIFDLKKILRPLEETVLLETAEGAAAADTLVRVNLVQTLRSIIAGFVGISQILRIMGIAGEANDAYERSVLEGSQPVMEGVKERVIRLGGKDSDVTALSMERYGAHMVPIFEVPDMVRGLMDKHSYGGRLPVYWNVPSGAYSLLSSQNKWRGFAPTSDWLIPVKVEEGGKEVVKERVLVVEADSSVGEQSLALGIEAANDLSIQEVGQAFVSLQTLLDRVVAGEMGKSGTTGLCLPPARLLRVLMCDCSQVLVSGGGSTSTMRAYVESHDEADVLIDAKAPLLMAVEQWATTTLSTGSGASKGKAGGQGWERRGAGKKGPIIFDTHNRDYYRTMKSLLESRGWTVRDRPAAGDTSADDAVWLVYENSTVDTVHKMRTLVKNGHVQPGRACALLDKAEGMSQLEALGKEMSLERGGEQDGLVLADPLPFVCSSLIYDDLFALVRRMVRDGHSNKEVQVALDAKLQGAM